MGQHRFLFSPSGFARNFLKLPLPSVVVLWALSVSLLVASCEKKDDSLIDIRGAAPLVSNGRLSLSAIDTDTIYIYVGADRKPDDILPLTLAGFVKVFSPAGQNQLSAVRYLLANGDGSTVLSSGAMHDDGLSPDLAKGDSIYSAMISFQITRSVVGTLFVEFGAQDPSGFESNTLVLPLRIFRTNRAPVLSNLNAPDTVALSGQTQIILLEVAASDSDGQADIRKVQFNSFKPDSTPSSGNPFQMYDDGGVQSGDKVKGDGVYSLTIQLPPTTPTGSYRFEFQAFDRSAAGSNTIAHRITVK